MATIKSYLNCICTHNRYERKRAQQITRFLTEIRENAPACYRGYGYIIQYLNKKWIISEDSKSGTIRTITYKEVKQLLTGSYYI